MKNTDNVLFARLTGFEEFRHTLKNVLKLVLLDEEKGCRECSARSGCCPGRHGLCRDCGTRKNIFELKVMISQLEGMGL